MKPGTGGSGEITAAGFWTGFNLVQTPAYMMLAQGDFFSPFGYLLFAILAPLALIVGLIGIAVAHIAAARANRRLQEGA